MKCTIGRALAAILIGLACFGQARADINDYEFRLFDGKVRIGDDVIVAVRVVDKRTGKPTPEAVIYARRIDMAPDGMREMTAPLEPLAATEPGLHRFRTSLTMAGGWQLSLGAKVQGELGTVVGRLLLEVTE